MRALTVFAAAALPAMTGIGSVNSPGRGVARGDLPMTANYFRSPNIYHIAGHSGLSVGRNRCLVCNAEEWCKPPIQCLSLTREPISQFMLIC